ncbi:MAG: 8-oxo-dGTP diphosphatase MutT [Alphaproteobacteria bacterium]|nr:8-oxo-dGTP diphosphatase MutT [Alphaproteobacteria bacterium]
MTHPLVYAVAVALVDETGRLLIAERPQGKSMAGFWEFPGGKIEPGETPSQAICRESTEELGVGIAPESLVPISFVEHDYPHFTLILFLYLSRDWQGEVMGQEGQELAWVTGEELRHRQLLPADQPLIEPLLQAILPPGCDR